MATRMQQRRGTAAQWTAANPVLAAGEIGFETDTNKFKVGNGSTAWASLTYFVDASVAFDSDEVTAAIEAAIANVIDLAPETLDTLNELAAAVGDNPDFANSISNNIATINSAIENNSNSIANIITEIQELEYTLGNVNVDLSNSISNHELSTTNIHGIANTATLVTTDDSRLSDDRTPVDLSVTTGKIDDEAVTTEKIANTAVTEAKIASSAVTSDKIAADAVDGTKIADDSIAAEHIADEVITNAHISNTAAIAQSKIDGLTTDLNNKQDKVADVSDTEIGYLANVTSDIQSQIDAKASLSGATFTGNVVVETDLTIDGNLIVSGTTTTVNANDLVVSDPLIYIGEGNTGNLVDLGLVSSFDDGTYQHSGIARDASDGKWKLFKGVTDEPTTTINFAQGSLDTLAVGALESTNAITASGGVAFSDGTQTKEGVPSKTTISEKTSSYTLSSLAERDSLIEFNSSSSITLNVPLNSAVAFPIGTSVDILQTGSGQLTVYGDDGVTLNYTPGNKLRSQWSSATLFKRGTDSWVLLGDLTA